MKVIMTTTVPKVGKEGQVVTVKDGYARNYLFPRGYALLANKSQLKVLEMKDKKAASKAADTKSAAEAIAEKLNGQSIRIEGKVGKELGKLFGAITAQDVADAIKAQLSVEVEKRQVALVEPIKRLGTFPILVDLHREVDATVTLTVFDPTAPVESEAKEEKPADEEKVAEPVA